MAVIIFDTETFGKIDSIEENIENLKAWPDLKQICWQTYDLNGNILKTSNHYFENKLNDKLEILKEFVFDFQNSKLSVAHNFIFDFKIITAELLRLELPIHSLENVTIYDTMTNNIELCAIKSEYGYFKYPTLIELHQLLFEDKFEGAHDAKNDVDATAKCFWKLRAQSKIDFENLPNVKLALQFEEEKLIDEISIFYGTRKKLGEFLYEGCSTGIIGHMINNVNQKITNENNNTELSPFNIHSHPRQVLNWILEFEKIFLESPSDKNGFYKYAEYRALKETVDFLKNRNLYYPRESGKFHEPFVLFYLSDMSKNHFDKIASMKLYDIIANMITKYEALNKEYEYKKIQSSKNNSGCLVIILIFLTLGLIKYFA